MADLKTEDLLTIQDVDDNKGGNSSSIEEQTPKQKRENGESGRGVLEVWFVLITMKLFWSTRQRYINPAAIVNFGFTLQAAWEAAGSSFQFSLLNGGPASLVYGSIVAGLGSTAIATSLAEMASLWVCLPLSVIIALTEN
jgi:hypothetical protein